MTCLGVDGAGAGWIAVWRAGDTLAFARYPDAQALWGCHRGARVIVVDIPIGLPDSGPRASDALARRLLGPRRSGSIFPAPVRAILDAGTRLQASDAQRRIDGRGLSAQAFALFPKIRQWDSLVQSDPLARATVHEGHPEVSLAALRGGAGLGIEASKRTAEGQAIRIGLLGQVFGNDSVTALVRSVPRKLAATDDVLDALALLWTAERITRRQAMRLPDPPVQDASGLPMAIWY